MPRKEDPFPVGPCCFMESTRVSEVGILQQASPDLEVFCAKWNWYFQQIGSQGVGVGCHSLLNEMSSSLDMDCFVMR